MSFFSLRLADERIVKLLKPSVMGVINLSPDSFFRPYNSTIEIYREVEKMVSCGVDIIDVGGEATNLKVDINNPPSTQEQIDRIIPVIEFISKQFPVLISVDTSQPPVMREAVSRGAHIINDQRGLKIPGALETVVELKTPVCLMHFFPNLRNPGQEQQPELMKKIKTDLLALTAYCRAGGIDAQRIIIDPGFGQGHYRKNAAENFYLLAHLNELTDLEFPLLAGWSRKSMIGEALGGVAVEQRLYGSIAAAMLAAMKGASIIRVHDVAETMDAIKIFRATFASGALAKPEPRNEGEGCYRSFPPCDPLSE